VFGCDVYHPEAFDDQDAGADAGGQDAGVDAGLDAGPTDAGFDAGPTDAGFDAGYVCIPRVPPPRPTGGGDGADLVFVLRNVVLEQGGTVWNELGFDLDRTCTISISTTTCEPRSGASPALDGLDGVDNANGREILIGLTLINPGLQRAAQAQQDLGISAMVLHIAGYDGGDDDALVTASLSQSLYAVPMGGARWDILAWDGTDTFFASERDYVDGDVARPLVVDSAAYVHGRTLVMHLPEGRTIYLPWASNPLAVRLTDAVLVGELSEDLSRIDDVRLAGRWALVDIGTSLTQIGQCPGSSERRSIDALVDRGADIRSDPTSDGLRLPCDSVSSAFGLEGTRAILGGTVPVPATVDLCPGT